MEAPDESATTNRGQQEVETVNLSLDEIIRNFVFVCLFFLTLMSRIVF